MKRYNKSNIERIIDLENKVDKLILYVVSKSLPSDIEVGKAMSELSKIADKEAER
jgi:hypothetical protein